MFFLFFLKVMPEEAVTEIYSWVSLRKEKAGSVLPPSDPGLHRSPARSHLRMQQAAAPWTLALREDISVFLLNCWLLVSLGNLNCSGVYVQSKEEKLILCLQKTKIKFSKKSQIPKCSWGCPSQIGINALLGRREKNLPSWELIVLPLMSLMNSFCVSSD